MRLRARLAWLGCQLSRSSEQRALLSDATKPNPAESVARNARAFADTWEYTPHNKAPQMRTGTAWALRLAVWSVERGQQLTGEAGGW